MSKILSRLHDRLRSAGYSPSSGSSTRSEALPRENFRSFDRRMDAMRSRACWTMVGVVGLVALALGARADETEIKLDQVPKPVMDSAKAKFPGAKLTGASKETEDGKTVFEVSLTHNGH